MTTDELPPAFSSDEHMVVVHLMDAEFRMLQKLIGRNYGYTAQEVLRRALRILHKRVEM